MTLGTAGLSDSSQDPSRPNDTRLGMTRSASSPRLSSEADAKVQYRLTGGARTIQPLPESSNVPPPPPCQEPRMARVPPIPTRRLFSIPDSSPDNSNRWGLAALVCVCTRETRICLCPHIPAVQPLGPSVCLSPSWLSRSSSYTRRLHAHSGHDFTSSTPFLLHRSVALLTARHRCASHLFVCLLSSLCVLAESQPRCVPRNRAWLLKAGFVLAAHRLGRDWMTPP